MAFFLAHSFNDMFLLHCDVHPYNTRSKKFFRLPYWRTNVRKFSLRFQGAKIFNFLSPEIQNASSAGLFNSKLKSYFLSIARFISYSLLSLFFSFILALFFLTFSFSFLHLHVQPFLFYPI